MALVLARVSALCVLAPTFSSRQVPAMLQVAIIVLLTALAWPVARALAPGAVAITGPALVREVLTGGALGLGVAVTVGAAEMAGDLIGTRIGLSGAASLDPVTFTQTPVMGTFMRLLVLTTLLTLDLHLVLVDGLVASFRAVPLDATGGLEAMAITLAGSAAPLFADGLRMAAPVLVTIIVLDVALGLLAKAAPQLQVMSVSYALQTGIGLLTMGAALPFVVASLGGWTGTYDAFVDRALAAFATGSR